MSNHSVKISGNIFNYQDALINVLEFIVQCKSTCMGKSVLCNMDLSDEKFDESVKYIGEILGSVSNAIQETKNI